MSFRAGFSHCCLIVASFGLPVRSREASFSSGGGSEVKPHFFASWRKHPQYSHAPGCSSLDPGAWKAHPRSLAAGTSTAGGWFQFLYLVCWSCSCRCAWCQKSRGINLLETVLVAGARHPCFPFYRILLGGGWGFRSSRKTCRSSEGCCQWRPAHLCPGSGCSSAILSKMFRQSETGCCHGNTSSSSRFWGTGAHA